VGFPSPGLLPYFSWRSRDANENDNQNTDKGTEDISQASQLDPLTVSGRLQGQREGKEARSG
jgi:hypothetical protein